MGKLLWEKPSGLEIMRCKGRVYGVKEGLLYEYLLQGVEDVFELREMGSV